MGTDVNCVRFDCHLSPMLFLQWKELIGEGATVLKTVQRLMTV